MPNLLKIGFTNRNVKDRVQELSASTGVPTSFEVEYYCLTCDVEIVEAEVHNRLSKYRKPGKEFFSVSLVQAVETIDSLIRDVKPDRFSRVSKPVVSAAIYLCQSCGAKNISHTCERCGREGL